MTKPANESPKENDRRTGANPKQSIDTPRGAPPPEEQPNPGDPGPPVLKPER